MKGELLNVAVPTDPRTYSDSTVVGVYHKVIRGGVTVKEWFVPLSTKRAEGPVASEQ